MTTTEFLVDIMKDILGDQYKVVPNHNFQKDYIKPLQTPYGTQYDLNYQTFREYANTIVCVVETRSAEDYATPYAYANATFTASFWVPVNILLPGEKPKFTFDADMAKLKARLTSETFMRADGEISLRASVSCGEPHLLSTSQDKSGAYTRIVMQVGGRISLADWRAGIGGDTKIAFVIDGEEHYVPNVTNLLIGSTVTQNALETSDEIEPAQNVAMMAQGISFAVDDFDDGSKAFELIERRAIENAQIVNTTGSEDGRRKIKVRVYRNGKLRRETVGAVEVQYSAASKMAFGRFSVSVTADAGD